MNILKFIIVCLLALSQLQGCAGNQILSSSIPKQFLSRQVIVTLSEENQQEWEIIDRQIQARYGIAKVGEFGLRSIHADCLVYRIPEHLSMAQIIHELAADKRVQMVEPNQFFESMSAGDGDPFSGMEYGVKYIGADRVHPLSTGKYISIAIIDTGIDSDHPDLRGRIVDSQNFVEGGDSSFKTDAHGTAMAGIIGAEANDGMGILGVAPDTRITALKACWYGHKDNHKARCASWTLAKALDYAINHHIRIINLSLSGPPDQLLKTLLAQAHKKGITLVAAANEDQTEPGFPASFPDVIPVISSDSIGKVVHPSWLPKANPLAAPGIEVLTTTPKGYDFFSGSSLAAAHVSGVIALLLQLRPQLSPDEIFEILKKSATFQRTENTGIVNACKALVLIGTPPQGICNENPVTKIGVYKGKEKLIAIKDYLVSSASASTNNFQTGATHGFFTKLGTNGRTCNTCHLQNEAWTFTPAHAQQLAITKPSDPLFAPVDGSDCPPTSPSQKPDARLSKILVNYGLVRVQLGIPEEADFFLANASNPEYCKIPPGDAGINKQLFLFRRPLPPTNLIFLSSVMWDGRKTLQPMVTSENFSNTAVLVSSLLSQANDGVLKHAQGNESISGTQAHADILAFEQNLYSAQLRLNGLNLEESNGGPRFIAEKIAPNYFVGQNDSLSGDYNNEVFSLFKEWEPGNRPDKALMALQASIGRGEQIFNTRSFMISNVPGLNSSAHDPLYNPKDPFPDKAIIGTCGTCHNTPNIGNHSTALPLNIGVTMADIKDNEGKSVGFLSAPMLPIYTLRSQSGSEVQVTDPGRALVTGKWTDIGKLNSPVLRGLNGRAPYFHNGSAKNLTRVVQFYNARFNIGLTTTEINDLAIFLSAL